MEWVYLGSVVAIAAALVFFSVWTLGTALRRERVEARQVRAPDGGAWSTRIQWSHSRIRLGVADRVFVRRERPDREGRPEAEADDSGRKRYGPGRAVGDLLSGIDEGILLIGGVIAVGVVVVGTVLLLVLAVELVLFLVVAAVVGAGRLVLRHPWVIEVEDPSGELAQVEVSGFRAARRAEAEIRERIAAGVAFTPGGWR